jgi:hypothetical protein
MFEANIYQFPAQRCARRYSRTEVEGLNVGFGMGMDTQNNVNSRGRQEQEDKNP